MERMSTLDAGFFFAEHANAPMHLGALAVFEGAAPSDQELAGLYAAKLSRVRRYRQVVRTVPLHIFRPAWADDEHFELGHHLRRAAVPRPGRASQLHRLAGQIYAQPLDRTRPLWEAWLLDGIDAGRWAILSKVHHCIVDGIGGAALMAELLDLCPDAGPPAQSEVWQPQPWPSLPDALAGGLRDAVICPLQALAGVPGLLRQRLPAGPEMAAFAGGLASSARRLAEPSASCLNGPIGPGRRWALTTASLTAVREIRAEFGCTVNDIVLAAITRGFRDLLLTRGGLADGLIVRSLVPISIRCEDEHGAVTNRLSAVFSNLPVAESDPIRRLQLVSDQMGQIKRTRQAAGPELLTQLLTAAPPALLNAGTRAASRIRQPLVQTVTTNVPGPQFPLYLLGRKMLQAHPYTPIADNVKMAVAVFSYLGQLSFGITAESSAASDLGILTKGISRGLAELHPERAPASRAGLRSDR
ncbi:MAG TPA: wax ester/triacylglycerol synthase family O-acyltransferase [Streptosporangiaceae bacterium]|nr:wax ester/triacylglycerol synthase family O-acyltransferase [Streptosporangiaceae bacterium]